MNAYSGGTPNVGVGDESPRCPSLLTTVVLGPMVRDTDRCRNFRDRDERSAGARTIKLV